MDALIIFVAEYVVVIPVVIAAVVFLQRQGKSTKWLFIIELIIAGIVALALARLASMLWYDPRPFVVGHFTPLLAHSMDNGFPSDHTLLASLVGWVVLAYSRTYGGIILILALLVGTARVLAGVHHPLDIVGSFVISGVAALITIYVVRFVQSKRAKA